MKRTVCMSEGSRHDADPDYDEEFPDAERIDDRDEYRLASNPMRLNPDVLLRGYTLPGEPLYVPW